MWYKSCSNWLAGIALLVIVIITVFSGRWLWKMTDVLTSPPGQIEVLYVEADSGLETKKVKNDETQYELYKQAEESFRELLNTWLTIVGFFGALLGLIVPLASYLLQRHSLSEERERIMKDVEKAAADAAEDASKDAAEAKKAAEKAANDAANDAEEAKKSASAAEAEAQMAVEDLKTAKGEIQAQLKDALERIEQASRDAKEAKAEAGKAQEMVREVGKTMQPVPEVRPKSEGASDTARAEFERIKQKAEHGDAMAQNRLGYRYQYGLGVEKDEFDAVYWYRKAANQGYAVAQYNLGLMYDFARGVDKNYEVAVSWYRKAAAQGHAAAENNLGFMLETGQGCEKNEKEALEWYHKSAEHGDAMGRKNLGVIYEKGLLGVKPDLSKAKELYQQVIDDKSADGDVKKLAQEGLDRIAKEGGGK